MGYTLEFSSKADNDIKQYKRGGNQALLEKLYELLSEIADHPRTGTGKPERLKHYKIPTYSRRISKKHRLVYQIKDDVVIVLILSAYGHYEDK